MTPTVVDLSEFRTQQVKRPTKVRRKGRYHWLGAHVYAAQPGSAWSAEFWIRTSVHPNIWELYCSTERPSKRKQFMGFYTPSDLLDYLTSIDFATESDDIDLIKSLAGAQVIRLIRRD